MKNQVDLEFRQDALEHGGIEDGPGELAVDEPRDLRVERVHVERHHLFLLLGEVRDQGVADFAIRAGYQDYGFTHWMR